MSLIVSDRHSPEDLRHWAMLERHDASLAKSPRLAKLVEQATRDMADFAASGPCYISVSWGKDSVTVASLAALAGLKIPIRWLRWPPVEDPDCVLVRDAFLKRFPGVDYAEVTAPLRWYPDRHDWLYVDRRRGDFAPLHDVYGSRRISGVRSEESSARLLRQKCHGVSTTNTCAPITRWTAINVFAFAKLHDLPIHPAYGCSWGGMMDRRMLRVDVLDSDRAKAWGGEEWERWYYREEMLALDRAKAHDIVHYAGAPYHDE